MFQHTQHHAAKCPAAGFARGQSARGWNQHFSTRKKAGMDHSPAWTPPSFAAPAPGGPCALRMPSRWSIRDMLTCSADTEESSSPSAHPPSPGDRELGFQAPKDTGPSPAADPPGPSSTSFTMPPLRHRADSGFPHPGVEGTRAHPAPGTNPTPGGHLEDQGLLVGTGSGSRCVWGTSTDMSHSSFQRVKGKWAPQA